MVHGKDPRRGMAVDSVLDVTVATISANSDWGRRRGRCDVDTVTVVPGNRFDFRRIQQQVGPKKFSRRNFFCQQQVLRKARRKKMSNFRQHQLVYGQNIFPGEFFFVSSSSCIWVSEKNSAKIKTIPR